MGLLRNVIVDLVAAWTGVRVSEEVDVTDDAVRSITRVTESDIVSDSVSPRCDRVHVNTGVFVMMINVQSGYGRTTG